ncbi:DUF1631 family protein [Acidovorax lacteus]|uniref:DUF1631 family protein n=1 Tax=Acidovorax lacteus TaxID=1924988 RepID=A0ABP8KVV5_9BURK
MSQTTSRSRTVFRACVVNAVRGGESLMQRLVQLTQGALASEESQLRDIYRRNLLSDAMRLLKQHESALVKGYAMALLEIFAEGPSLSKGRVSEDTGMDFGELTLMDDHAMQDQVELSRAQQLAVHATDAVLSELNTLVSSAQGLRSVQPERNPLRPESYIRALQRVTGETGAPGEVRQVWLERMRDQIGPLLADEYRTIIRSLREHGVEPVGYAVAGSGGRSGYGSVYGGAYTGGYGGGPGSGYGASGAAPLSGYGASMYGRAGATAAPGWTGESQQAQLAAEAEEALLTVGILRQMLAGGGDPFDPRVLAGPVAPTVVAAAPGLPTAGRAPGWSESRAVPATGAAGLSAAYLPQAAAEAMEDIAQLERIVGRLSGSTPSSSAPLSGWRGTPQAAAPRVYTVPMGAATESPAHAAEVVARMMENIAQDTRLLPPVLRAVQNLAPALQRLVRHDLGFFNDAAHPARRLLDEMTERSLGFASETAPGFSQFMKLMDEAVAHLTKVDIQDAGPFDTVLKALQNAWDTQQQRLRAHQLAKERAKRQEQRRRSYIARMSERLQDLPDLAEVPEDVAAFVTGPWLEAAAHAYQAQFAVTDVTDEGMEEDPKGYLALVSTLLWSAQPERTRHETERLSATIPALLASLREGLDAIQYPVAKSSAFLERLVALHQAAFEAVSSRHGDALQELIDPEELAEHLLPAEPAGHPEPEAPVATSTTERDEAASDEAFRIGCWVEITSHQRAVRTQLTWCSPQRTLFLFTAPDGSTQSMTRRVRDKMIADGQLKLVPSATSGEKPSGAARLGRSGSASA